MLSRITQRQLEYLIAAGEAGSIIGASERIHVSSPSISAAIAHIESELGVQLFVRHHAQGLSPTPVGLQVMKEARMIVEQLANLYAVASESANLVRGPLRVGLFDTFAPMVAAELVHGFARAFPAARVTQVEGDQESLLAKLLTGDIDIAVTYDLNLTAGVHFEALASLPPHVIVGEYHPLAGRPSVTLADLAEHPMVLLDMPHSRDYFMSLFRDAGVAPDIRVRSANMEVVRALVANGIGYGISNVRPRANVSLDGRRLVRVRIAGDQRPMRVGLATAVDVKSSRTTGAFAQRCRAFVSDHYIPGMAAARFFDPHWVRDAAEPGLPDTLDGGEG